MSWLVSTCRRFVVCTWGVLMRCASVLYSGCVRCLCLLCSCLIVCFCFFFFFQAEDGIRDYKVTGVQTCALPICTTTSTHAAGGALGADRNPALWPVTVPPHISRTRVQPAGTEKREMSTLTATASLSEQEARGIVDAIPQTIVVLSPDGAALYANRSVLAYTGLTIDEMMAADFRTRVFHPEDVARLLDQRRDGLARGVPFELEQRARRHDGQYRWFLVQYNPDRK